MGTSLSWVILFKIDDIIVSIEWSFEGGKFAVLRGVIVQLVYQ